MMEEQIKFLKEFAYCLGSGSQLELEGECGFGRECVGILCNGNWVDYDSEADGMVSPPADAYHKYDCLAVLGRGDKAVQQLHDWCQSLKDAGFGRVQIRQNPDAEHVPPSTRQMMAMMGTLMTPIIVKSEPPQ